MHKITMGRGKEDMFLFCPFSAKMSSPFSVLETQIYAFPRWEVVEVGLESVDLGFGGARA
jgi:hypothetical protein